MAITGHPACDWGKGWSVDSQTPCAVWRCDNAPTLDPKIPTWEQSPINLKVLSLVDVRHFKASKNLAFWGLSHRCNTTQYVSFAFAFDCMHIPLPVTLP